MAKNYNEPTSNRMLDRMRMNPLLTWLSDMIQIAGKDEIKIPASYREKVLCVKKTLQSDTSGLINSILDFAIDSSLVDYYVESDNKTLTDLLNKWLDNINLDLRGEVPVGVKALAKEYFRERWKGSSFLLLRTFWEKKDGIILPTVLYFVDGEDIIVDYKGKSKNLMDKEYYLRISKNEKKKIGTKENERLFIQRPFSSWGDPYATPFVIQRGVYRNLKFLELLEKKGEFVVGKALEYIGILKKGTENMALSNQPDFIYSQEDLNKASSDFKTFINKRRTTSGVSVYTTNFDTELEHSIPEYARALKQELYTPIERRILGGLGLIEIVQGIASTRKEAIMNPKPFFSEVRTGVSDFRALLLDLIRTIIELNVSNHKKYFNNAITISSSVVADSLSDKVLSQIRGGYDRGVISKRSYTESLSYDFDNEVKRRRKEEPLKEVTFPPVIQNIEKDVEPTQNTLKKKEKEEKTPPDKKGPEKKNFNKAGIFGEPYDPRKSLEGDFEQAPYTKDKYPSQLKNLPSGARSIWINTFNSVFNETNDKDNAREAAWKNVKLKYKKSGDKWVKKEKAEFEQAMKKLNVDDLIQIKELEILGKKSKLLDKLLENKNN